MATLVTVRFRGHTPLLFNAIPAGVLEGIRSKGENKKKYVAPKDPREEADTKVHKLTDGRPHIPVEMFMANLIEAGKYIPLKGKTNVSTATTTRLPGFLEIQDEVLLLQDPETGKKATWEVDMRPGRNPNGGELVCIVRPRFDRWRFDANLLVDDDQFSLNKMRELIDTAGRLVGLGDFRPARKGTFGKYRVECWTPKKYEVRDAAE